MRSGITKNNKRAIQGFFMCALLGAAVYAGTLAYPFVYDDLAYVQKNPRIVSLNPSMFISPFSAYAPGLYRPVTTLSYALDYSLSGLHPAGYHFSNILLHSVSSGLVFILALALIGNLAAAVVAGAVFAVHPVHTEAVSWVSGRSELLACMFVLLGIIFYMRSREKLSAGAYFLALLSKEIAAPMILVLPLFGKRSAKKYIPYVFALVAYALMRMAALGGVFVPMENIRIAGLSFMERMMFMIPVTAHYLKLMVWPVPLRLEYDWTEFSATTTVFSAAVLILAVAAGVLLHKNKRRLSALCVAWFFLFLLPVLNIIPIGEAVAERFLYLPSVGAAMLSGVVFMYIIHIKYIKYTYILLILVFSFMVVHRNQEWSDPEILWRSTLAVSPNAPHALQNLSGIMLAKGNLDESRRLIRRALRNWPEEPVLYFVAAQVYEKSGEPDKSTEMYENSLKLSAQDKFSMTLAQRGVAALKLGRLHDALEYLEKARSQNRYDPSVWNNLGILYARIGKSGEALDAFNRAVSLYENLRIRSAEEDNGYKGALENKDKLLDALRLTSAHRHFPR